MKKVIICLIVVLIIAALGIGGWFLVDSLNKSNNKVNELENRITKMEENKVSTNNTIDVNNQAVTNQNVTNNTNTTNTNTATNVATTNDNVSSNTNSSEDYSKYFGIWSGQDGEFEIKNIGNGYITCTWFIYRIASIDDVTLPFKDNKAVFYYQGYNDSNYNGVHDEGENYYRKATIELMTNGGVTVKVEDTTAEESRDNMQLNKSHEFGGAGYITAGEYAYLNKAN